MVLHYVQVTKNSKCKIVFTSAKNYLPLDETYF